MSYSTVQTIACLGAGLIGSGWATTFLWKGLAVNIYDPNEEQLAGFRDEILLRVLKMHNKL